MAEAANTVSKEGLHLSSEKCALLVSLLEEYKATKPAQLQPRFDEVIQYLKKEMAVSGSDAYQGRYIRDCLTFHKEKAASLTEVSSFLEKKFFPPEPPKAAPAPAAPAQS